MRTAFLSFLASQTMRAATRFARGRDGNVAVTFAIAVVPLLGFVGAAIDYSRGNSVKSSLQAALDSTALMLSRDAATLSNTELQSKADSYFKAMFTRSDVKNITVSATYTASGGSNVVVGGSVEMPTQFVKILGYETMTISGSSTAKWGSSRLRVALVLDTTGSMNSDGKITALKTATNNLLTQLQSAASTNGDVYVSIVPFSRNVNVDSVNYNANWIDWTEWEGAPAYMTTWLANSSNVTTWEQTGPGDACPFGNTWSGTSTGFYCTNSPTTGASTVSTVPSNGTYAGYICPSIDNGGRDTTKSGLYYNGCYNSVSATRTISSGSSASCGTAVNCSCSGSGSKKTCTQSYYTHTWIKNARSTWTGCVTDRGSSSAPGTTPGNDQKSTAPTTSDTTTLFPARQDTYCPPAEAMGLSYNWSAMTSLVNSLAAKGSTNQPIGLAMGWHSLTGIGPFTMPAKETGYTYNEVIILLSDGLNTQNRWYGNGSSTSTSVDYRMYDTTGAGTCANIKAANITIYTIQVNTGGDATSTLLQNCASSSDKFFLLTSASQIVTAFQQIGTNLTQLRVAK